MFSGRSLICRIKGAEPRREHWRMPALVLWVDVNNDFQEDLIIEKTLQEIPYLESLYSSPWCHTLSKAFNISRATILIMNLVSIWFCETSAMDLAGQNPYCLSLRRLFLLRCSLLIIDLKSLLLTLGRLIAQYFDRHECSPAFLETDTFPRLGKHLFFR